MINNDLSNNKDIKQPTKRQRLRKRIASTHMERVYLRRLQEIEPTYIAMMVEIRQRMKANKITLAATAAAMGASKRHLSKVLQGKAFCQADYLLLLCRATDTGLQLTDLRTVTIYSPNDNIPTHEHATAT